MRRLLGILRDDGAPALVPQPGITDLPTLAEAVRQAGVQAAITVEGEPRELPAGVALTAYRIVQEALTNTLKHAGPARATVIVRYDATALALEITDDGQAGSFGDAGSGHGLPGMQERVSMHGGRFLAGPGRDGGFSVSAWLPVEAAPS